MGLSPNVLICLFLLFSNVFSDLPYYRRHPCHRRTVPCDHPKPFSFYWEIKRPSPSPAAYLFGTIHVPYTKVWESIPQIAKDAFNRSDRIIFELDLLNEVTHSRLSKCQMLPSGKVLNEIIPREMYLRLEQHLGYVRSQIPHWMKKHYRGNGPFEADHLFQSKTEKWDRKGPIWVMMMLNSLTESDVKMYGIPVLDLFLAYEARNLNKEIGSVERPKDQCNPLNRMNITHAVFALEQTLLQHESIRRGTLNIDGTNTNTDELIKHYNCGNLNDVVFNQSTAQLPFLKNPAHKITVEELEISKQIDDYFRSHLIVNRNRRMSKQILQLLSANPNESLFFAFGAGHFIGKDSIIELLQNSGLEVVHVNENSPLHIGCYPPYSSIRNSGYPRLRTSISANPRPPTPNVNTRKGLARNPFITISPAISNTANSWIEDINRRTLLPKQQQQHHFSIKPLHSSLQYQDRSAWPSSVNTAQYPQTVSNTTSRHHLSFNDLLVRAYILNSNLHYAANAQWPRVYHSPVYRTDAHLSSSNWTGAQQKHHSWPYLTSANAGGRGQYSAPSCIIVCLFGLQLILTLVSTSPHNST